MKKVVGVLLALVILGNLVMPVMAAEVGKSYPCPSCSGVITIPNDVKSSIVQGSIAYLKAVQVFNSKDSLKLREQLKDLNLKPVYSKAIVQVVSYKGVTTEVVKIPLEGKKIGMLVHVRNKFGESTGIGIFTQNGMDIYLLENSKVVKKEITIKGNALKCTVCTVVVNAICRIGLERASIWGCAKVCGLACGALIEDPPAYVACALGCGYICLRVMDVIENYGCPIGAVAICERAGWC